IDLLPDGVNTNDLTPTQDADTGANNKQNFPEISAATISAGMISVTYRVPSDPANSTYPLRVEFFKADAAGQEGQTFLGFDTFTTADFAAGSKTFIFTPAAAVATGDKLVATATDTSPLAGGEPESIAGLAIPAGGNTSEFSVNALVTPSGCSLLVTTTADTVNAADGVNSLREAIICANTTPGADTITVP